MKWLPENDTVAIRTVFFRLLAVGLIGLLPLYGYLFRFNLFNQSNSVVYFIQYIAPLFMLISVILTPFVALYGLGYARKANISTLYRLLISLIVFGYVVSVLLLVFTIFSVLNGGIEF